MELIGWLCIAQSILLLFGIFVNPVQEHRSRFYIHIMPEIKHYSILMAELLFPIPIFTLSCLELLKIPSEYRLCVGVDYLFVMLSQVGILLLFVSFLPHFNAIFGGM